MRSKNVQPVGLETTGPGFAKSTQTKWDKDLDLYENAVKQGIQPETTQVKDVQKAIDASNQFGKPYRADL